MVETEKEIIWEYSLPLATNRFVLYDLGKVLLLTWGFILTLFTVIGLFIGDYQLILQMLVVFTIVIPVIGVALLLVMIVFFGNRMRVRFCLDSTGVKMEFLSKRGRWANRLAILFGLLTLNPAAAGAGLLAASRQKLSYRWKDFTAYRMYPKNATITLMGRLHGVLRLHSEARDFAKIQQRVIEKIPKR